MKKVFFTLMFGVAALSQLGCSGDAANNGAINVNAASPAPTAAAANIEPANTAAKTQETPLPTFTDANQALSEGVKLLDANSTEKAIEALRQAVKINPDLAEAHFRLGIAYGLIEAEQKEEQYTGEATPTPTPTPGKKGKAATPAASKPNSEKSFENAVKAYKKYLIKNPKDDAAHFNLGRAYNKLNEDKEAQKSLQQAVKLKPEDTEYQTEYGAILIKLAQYDEAVRALKKALEVDSSNLKAESLLEDATAGKKRVDFGKKTNAPNQPEPRRSSGGGDAPRPKAAPKVNAPADTTKPSDN